MLWLHLFTVFQRNCPHVDTRVMTYVILNVL